MLTQLETEWRNTWKLTETRAEHADRPFFFFNRELSPPPKAAVYSNFGLFFFQGFPARMEGKGWRGKQRQQTSQICRPFSGMGAHCWGGSDSRAKQQSCQQVHCGPFSWSQRYQRCSWTMGRCESSQVLNVWWLDRNCELICLCICLPACVLAYLFVSLCITRDSVNCCVSFIYWLFGWLFVCRLFV